MLSSLSSSACGATESEMDGWMDGGKEGADISIITWANYNTKPQYYSAINDRKYLLRVLLFLNDNEDIVPPTTAILSACVGRIAQGT